MMTAESPHPEDKVVILRRVPIFASCSEEQLQLIAARTRLVEYKKGEFVYREGAPADALYIVGSGRLRVFTQTNGPERTFAVLHNGDSFGEVSLLTGETHSATVQALNDTLILQLEKSGFDDVINRVPSLVLYLSRMLSKRLRTKEHGGEFADTTIVAMYSAAKGVGRTSFAVALAASLKRETTHSVIIVDFNPGEAHREGLYGPVGPQGMSRQMLVGVGAEEPVEAAVVHHPLGFSVLFADALFSEPGGEQAVAPLLNFLANRFHYILVDLPIEIGPGVLKALVQADLIYLMTDPDREHVIRTSALIHQLHASMGPIEQRMKIVLNMLQGPGEQMGVADITQQLGQGIAFTLPHVEFGSERVTSEELARLLESRASPYAVTVRRIARELGGLLVGLALGSGAALGLAHIGVLKVIEREKIPVDIIAGSSIGALVAGLWASGRSADELEAMALRFKNPWNVRQLFVFDFAVPVVSLIIGAAGGVVMAWLAGFWAGFLFGSILCVGLGLASGPLVGGPIEGARLTAKLQADFAGKTFEDTWLPVKIVASNPMAREEIIFDSGPLVDAVRASVSIPGIFKPVVIKGKICLDGGVVNPIPVSVLKRSGAHRIIAVNVFPTTPELTAHRSVIQQRRAERDAQLASRSLPFRLFYRFRQEFQRSMSPLVFDIIMRSMQSMEYQIAEVACREADITLRPTVPGSHWLEFFNPEKFIRRGEEIALQHLPELKRITQARGVDNAV